MTNRHKKMAVLGAVALLVVGAAVGLFFACFERVDSQVRQAPTGPARENSYLALQRLLGRFDHPTDTIRRLSAPTEVQTIFLANPSFDRSPDQINAWVEWVQAGGHLIMPQPGRAVDPNSVPLLTRLGWTKDDDVSAPSAWPDSATEDDIACEFGPAVADLNWHTPKADWLVRNDDGPVAAASRRVETGRVTLVRSATVFDNAGIGEAEHATLAVRVAGLETKKSLEATPITIVLFGTRQSWMMYVLGYVWPGLAVVVVGLFLALWATRRRFGPPLGDPPAQRRSRREHIDAVGRFLWRHGGVASLVEATQQALIADIEQRRPELVDATGSRRRDIVARELDISARAAADLLRKPSGGRNAESFVQTIRTLEHHRRHL